jgi:hypothetical protein
VNDCPQNPVEAECALRAMRSVATLQGRSVPLPIERELLLAVQKHVLGGTLDVDTLPAIAPGEVRAALRDPDQRAAVIRCAVLVPYVSLEVDQAKIATVDAFAMQLGIAPEVLRDLHQQRRTQLERAALDQARRGVRIYLTVRTSSLLRGIVDMLRRQRGDAELAGRYRALAALPSSSLGRALVDFYRSRGIALPGERRGLDERLVPHDLLHVVGGFAGDLADETALVGFAAGLARMPVGPQLLLEALAAMLTIGQLSGALAPGAPRPSLDAAALLAAYDRGVATSSDRLRAWSWWGDARTDLAEVRARFGVRVLRPVQPLPATAARAKQPRAA